MADYGLIVKNSSSEIQIDSLYVNFSKFGSGSLAISSGENTVNFTDTSKTPIIAIRPSSSTFCDLKRLNKSGSNYITATIEGEVGSSGTIYWLALRDYLTNALPTYGLVVRNSSNDVVFSSDEDYLKIKGVYSKTVTFGNYTDVTVNDADNNYFILYPFSYQITSVWMGTPPLFMVSVYCMGIKKISSTVVRIGTYIVQQSAEANPVAESSWHSDCKLIEVAL